VIPGHLSGGPTVVRIMLGAQLRRLREQAGISREDAGYHIRASGSKISRMELGRVSFRDRDVTDLADLYGVLDPTERDALLALVREANAAPWWQKYGDAMPDWFAMYVGLEESASLIRGYEMQFVPGLLQTEEYAQAVMKSGAVELPESEIERRIALRTGRQRLLTKQNAPRFWVVVDEAALRRPIGGRHVMRGQLEKLIAVADIPNVTLQVIPFRSGGHVAEGGAFTILRFSDPEMVDVVYLEQLTSAQYLDKPDDLDLYAAVMERLSVTAASPERTNQLLADMVKET
jgi:transcriptional regulator with XRE-family HTH domain